MISILKRTQAVARSPVPIGGLIRMRVRRDDMKQDNQGSSTARLSDAEREQSSHYPEVILTAARTETSFWDNRNGMTLSPALLGQLKIGVFRWR